MESLERRDELINRATMYALSGADEQRYNFLRSYVRLYNHYRMSPPSRRLSVGSGGHEPIRIGCNYALDVTPLAGRFLLRSGLQISYVCGDCSSLPFADKSFDVGVCSEVIEHLARIEDVEATLNELNRACCKWVVTTPSVQVPEPDHRRVFTYAELAEWAERFDAYVVRVGIWYIMYT